MHIFKTNAANWQRGWNVWCNLGTEEGLDPIGLEGYLRADRANELCETGDRPKRRDGRDFNPYLGNHPVRLVAIGTDDHKQFKIHAEGCRDIERDVVGNKSYPQFKYHQEAIEYDPATTSMEDAVQDHLDGLGDGGWTIKGDCQVKPCCYEAARTTTIKRSRV